MKNGNLRKPFLAEAIAKFIFMICFVSKFGNVFVCGDLGVLRMSSSSILIDVSFNSSFKFLNSNAFHFISYSPDNLAYSCVYAPES